MPRITQDDVESAFSERGFELRSTYVNCKTKMDVWCFNCNNLFQSTWSNFKTGHGCRNCANILNGHSKRKSVNEIACYFEDKGWTLLYPEQYKNNSSKLDVICDKNHETTKTYSDFKQGKGCIECKKISMSMLHRLPIKKAHAIAKKARLRLLTEDYINMKVDVLFECIECNFQFETCLDSIHSKGTGCPRCKCSQGERFLMNYFEKHEIGNKREKKFKDCKDIRPLPFDAYFVLDDIERVIEIDGIQHFKPVGMFGGEEALDRNYRIDTKKSLYCYNNGMSLLRISYLDLENLDDIMDDFISQSKEKTSMYYSNTEDYSKLITLIDDASKKQWAQ